MNIYGKTPQTIKIDYCVVEATREETGVTVYLGPGPSHLVTSWTIDLENARPFSLLFSAVMLAISAESAESAKVINPRIIAVRVT